MSRFLPSATLLASVMLLIMLLLFRQAQGELRQTKLQLIEANKHNQALSMVNAQLQKQIALDAAAIKALQTQKHQAAVKHQVALRKIEKAEDGALAPVLKKALEALHE